MADNSNPNLVDKWIGMLKNHRGAALFIFFGIGVAAIGTFADGISKTTKALLGADPPASASQYINQNISMNVRGADNRRYGTSGATPASAPNAGSTNSHSSGNSRNNQQILPAIVRSDPSSQLDRQALERLSRPNLGPLPASTGVSNDVRVQAPAPAVQKQSIANGTVAVHNPSQATSPQPAAAGARGKLPSAIEVLDGEIFVANPSTGLIYVFEEATRKEVRRYSYEGQLGPDVRPGLLHFCGESRYALFTDRTPTGWLLYSFEPKTGGITPILVDGKPGEVARIEVLTCFSN